jgi:hypothetical protein
MNGCLSFFAKIGWYMIWAFIASFVYVNGLNENNEFIWYDSIIKNIIASFIFFGPLLYIIWSLKKLIKKIFWYLYGVNYLILGIGLIVVLFNKENEDEFLFLKALSLFIVMTIPIFLKIRKTLINDINKKNNLGKDKEWIGRHSLYDLFITREVAMLLNPDYKKTIDYAKRKAKENEKKNQEKDFIKHLKIIHGPKYEYVGKSKDYKNLIILKCRVHGTEFTVSPENAIKRTGGCVKCEINYTNFKNRSSEQESSEKELIKIIESGFFNLMEAQKSIKSDTSKILTNTNKMMSEISEIKSLTKDTNESIEKSISKIINSVEKNHDFNTIEDYIPKVTEWFKFWDKIEENTKTFMPGSEWLYENIKSSDFQDFSPFVLYYCRALENELLKKIFLSFHDHINEMNDNELKSLFVWDKEGINEKKLKEYQIFFNQFKTNILKSRKKYTLGDMRLILNLLPNSKNKKGSIRYSISPLLKELNKFIKNKIGGIESETINRLENLIINYRNKSAHVDIIEEEKALIFYNEFKIIMNKLIGKF